MNDREERERRGHKGRAQILLVVGAVILILLLLFWTGLVDMAGGGADCITLF